MLTRSAEHCRTTEVMGVFRIHYFRRVATRYEKLADNYLAMLTIAAIMIWL